MPRPSPTSRLGALDYVVVLIVLLETHEQLRREEEEKAMPHTAGMMYLHMYVYGCVYVCMCVCIGARVLGG